MSRIKINERLMNNILFEPFKIKSVEQITLSTEEERRAWIESAGFNLFSLRSNQILIDLLTDSGTSAMSDVGWAEMLKADESYAGSRNFYELEETAQKITGMPFIVPVHQGRAAESILFSILLKGGELVPSNGLFDTTLANIQACGAQGINIPSEEALDPFNTKEFKGNIDIERLSKLLQDKGMDIPFAVMTITNNTGGGQPASLENLEKTYNLLKKHNKLLILDACRFAENAFFIKTLEKSYKNYSVEDIALKCFSLCDAMTFSGKKDGLANIGGLICLRDEALSEEVKTQMILKEGFPTYGGLAGYSLAALNQGLKEVLDEKYLEYRLRTISWMVERLIMAGVPVLRPAGGHAIYLEASKFFPHIPRENLPGIALCTELYIRGGIRACELGTVAFGYRDKDGKHILPPLDFVRLALPRRVYTEAHMGYVVEQIINLFDERESINGYSFKKEFAVLRHFRSTYKKL